MLQGDLATLEKQIPLIEKNIVQKKGGRHAQPDVNFYNAFIKKVADKMKQAIDQLLVKKPHQSRNKYLDPTLYSFPAITYAKLAWMNGIELKFDNPLMLPELLPVEPLEEYKLEYDFLK